MGMAVTDRQVLFLMGCVVVRSLLCVLVSRAGPDLLHLLAIPFTIMSIMFAYLFATNGRMDAPEGGGVTWWAQFRIVHALLYGIAAALAAIASEYTTIPLLADVVFGLILYIINHTT